MQQYRANVQFRMIRDDVRSGDQALEGAVRRPSYVLWLRSERPTPMRGHRSEGLFGSLLRYVPYAVRSATG